MKENAEYIKFVNRKTLFKKSDQLFNESIQYGFFCIDSLINRENNNIENQNDDNDEDHTYTYTLNV